MSDTLNQTRLIYELATEELEHPGNNTMPKLLDYVNSTADPQTELVVIATGAIFQHADYLRALHGTHEALNITHRALEILDLEDALEPHTEEQKADK